MNSKNNKLLKTSVTSLPRLAQSLDKHTDHIQCVSFDIFDTLLARHIEGPEQVQRAVCRELAEHLNANNIAHKSWTEEEIYSARQSAEKYLREQAAQQGQDYECRFSELVSIWLRGLFQCERQGLIGLENFIIQKELELEDLALFVKPEIPPLLAKLKQQGKHLLAVSDMYLDGQYIKHILQKKGILAYFDRVYVSADYAICKYSGRLFAKVIDDCKPHGIQANQILHVGDNPVSDVRMANQSGLHAIWLYETKALKRRKRQQLSSKMAKRQGLWQGRHFFECVAERMAEYTADDFFTRYGQQVLGPAFSVYTQALVERLSQKPVDKLYFLGRDGYIFYKLFQQTTLANQIDNEYIYTSRRIMTSASVADGLTLEQARVAFYNPKQQGLYSVFRVYGLLDADLEYLAKKHGFTDIKEAITDWEDQRLLAFLADEDVQNKIKQSGQTHKDLLEAYLEQIGFFAAKRVGFVDIGWNGTIQKFLKQTFGTREDFPVLYGYYFAFVPKLYNDFGENNFCEGLIHDSRRNNACERIPAEVEEIFEQGARSPDGTTLSYRWQDDKVVPVLKSDEASDRQAEIACNPWVAQIQQGVMEHFEHFQAMQKLTGYQSFEIMPYVHGLLERAVVYPNKEETHYLTQLVHTEDFGHDDILDIGRNAIRWQDFLHPVKLIRRVEITAWRYALFVNMPTQIANFFFRIFFLYTVKK
jgi:predicted HAD superfamily hydrolase